MKRVQPRLGFWRMRPASCDRVLSQVRIMVMLSYPALAPPVTTREIEIIQLMMVMYGFVRADLHLWPFCCPSVKLLSGYPPQQICNYMLFARRGMGAGSYVLGMNNYSISYNMRGFTFRERCMCHSSWWAVCTQTVSILRVELKAPGHSANRWGEQSIVT